MRMSELTRIVGGVVVTLTIAAALAPAALGEQRPASARSGVEMQFLDPRIPADERTVLEATVGYAPPALPDGAAWVGDATVDFGALRGTVVVIQAYTRGDADGRAALRRTEDILKNVGGDQVRLIALHTPEEAESAAKFFSDRPPALPTILDRVGAFCDELGVYQRPVTIMIDRSGRIRYPGVAVAKLRPAVELLVSEPFDAAAAAPPVLPPRSTRIAGEGGGAPGAPAPAGAPLPPFPPKPPVGDNARDVFGKQGPSTEGLEFLTDAPETEGRVVMVEFWATWCPPCVANIPHLNELHEKFQETVAIIGVSKEDLPVIRAFMTSHDFDYTVARDKGGVINKDLAIRGIPHAIIMSPDGVVRWQGHPAGLDEKTLQAIVDASGVTAGGGTPKSKRWVTAS